MTIPRAVAGLSSSFHGLREVHLALNSLARWPAWRVGATALIAYLGFVIPIACVDGPDSFIRVGSSLTGKSDRSSRISNLHATTRVGYDGQYAYFIALDPLRARNYMDRPSYRYGRIFYPVVAGAAAFGQPGVLPYTLLAINLVAMALMVFLLARYLERRDASPWWAAVYGFFPGLLISLLADLTEPLAYLFAGCAVLLLERHARRPLGAAVLFALAALTRETTLVFPVLAAAAIALSGRTGHRLTARSVGTAAWFAAVATAPYVAYRLALAHWLGTGLEEGGNLSPAPFGGFAKWPFDRVHLMLALAVILPGLVWLALAGWAAVTGRVGLAIGLVVANVAAFVVWLPPDVYANFGSADRASVGLALAAVLAVPLLRGFPPLWNRLVPSALALLTLGWTIVSAGLALGM